MMFKVAIWTIWLASSSADLKTTHDAIARGAHEANPSPLMQGSNLQRDAVTMGVSSGLACMMTCSGWEKKHPKLAMGITLAFGAAHTAAAVHNLRQGR